MEFFATCGTGLEPVLGDELRRIGVGRVRPLSGGVSFEGPLEDAYRALLWSRVSSRVLLTLSRVDASSSDALYRGASEIPWEDHLAPGRTISVFAHGVNDVLRDTRYTGQVVKDGIVDRMRDRVGARPDVDPADPDLLVNVSVSRGRAVVSIDLSGRDSLEDRGYRGAYGPNAPHAGRGPHLVRLHETLAAAMLLAAGWGKPSLAAATLVNPLCADGTLAIEAALIAGDVAPGITRERWGFEGWSGHDEGLWERLLDEADARAEERGGQARGPQGAAKAPRVLASDPDPAALGLAARRAKAAGVADAIEFAPAGFEKAAPPEGVPLVLACNLAPSDRMLPAQLPSFCSQLLPLVARAQAVALLSAGEDVDGFLGCEATRAHEAKNGPADASLRVYFPQDSAAKGAAAGPAPKQPRVSVRDTQVPVADAVAQQFASRLNKVAKQRRKWAKRAKVSAYRVYDADLPDYNLAIDLYRGAGSSEGRTLVHVAEYAPPKQIDPVRAAQRLADALRIIPVVLEVDPRDVYVKRRVRAKGGSQYAASGSAGGAGGARGGAETSSSTGALFPPRLVTGENGLLFEVDLGDYLDTGLFLDHRMTRALVGMLAKGRSFLNLFAYTGTASVYAAAAGAKFTTTVDLSNTYLDWARRNFELNGLLDRRQEFVRADVLSWTAEMRHSKNRWDLVFCDPPTFSNSSKMGRRSWDVQRDHAELLIDVSRLLTRKGVAVFSCNLAKFKLDAATLAKAGIQVSDITAKTIPEDFSRNQRVHHCYLLRRA